MHLLHLLRCARCKFDPFGFEHRLCGVISGILSGRGNDWPFGAGASVPFFFLLSLKCYRSRMFIDTWQIDCSAIGTYFSFIHR